MVECQECGRADVVAEVLGVCADCIRVVDEALTSRIEALHAHHRRSFGLPGQPPHDPDGLLCGICRNKCRIAVKLGRRSLYVGTSMGSLVLRAACQSRLSNFIGIRFLEGISTGP